MGWQGFPYNSTLLLVPSLICFRQLQRQSQRKLDSISLWKTCFKDFSSLPQSLWVFLRPGQVVLIWAYSFTQAKLAHCAEIQQNQRSNWWIFPAVWCNTCPCCSCSLCCEESDACEKVVFGEFLSTLTKFFCVSEEHYCTQLYPLHFSSTVVWNGMVVLDLILVVVWSLLCTLWLVLDVQSRLAVNAVTSGDYQRPFDISAFLNQLNSAFQLLNLKNDQLRKRYDGLKYDVKKVEEVVYDLSIRGLKPAASQVP